MLLQAGYLQPSQNAAFFSAQREKVSQATGNVVVEYFGRRS